MVDPAVNRVLDSAFTVSGHDQKAYLFFFHGLLDFVHGFGIFDYYRDVQSRDLGPVNSS